MSELFSTEDTIYLFLFLKRLMLETLFKDLFMFETLFKDLFIFEFITAILLLVFNSFYFLGVSFFIDNLDFEIFDCCCSFKLAKDL